MVLDLNGVMAHSKKKSEYLYVFDQLKPIILIRQPELKKLMNEARNAIVQGPGRASSMEKFPK